MYRFLNPYWKIQEMIVKLLWAVKGPVRYWPGWVVSLLRGDPGLGLREGQGWWVGEGLRKRAFRPPPGVERSLHLRMAAAASRVTGESVDQARLSSQDQFTAG